LLGTDFRFGAARIYRRDTRPRFAMNKFVNAIKALDVDAVRAIVASEPKWLTWEEKDGKNGIHFLSGIPMVEVKPDGRAPANRDDAESKSLKILQFLLRSGMDINSVHRISDKNCGYFPATPVWWSYARGRNETLYKYLLKQGADPRHCMYAITWYDDTEAAQLFKKYGVFLRESEKSNTSYFEDIDDKGSTDSPLLAAWNWKKWKMAEWLLKNGADPNAADDQGRTALFHAVKRKYDSPKIKLLLKYGGDPDKETNDGNSARSLASKYRDKTFSDLFD
jgi:hypothetical protein